MVGIALDGGKGVNTLGFILGYFISIGYFFIFSFPAFLTFITSFSLFQFLISKFTNYDTKKPAWYNWFSFIAVILTIIYAFLIIPYYLPNVSSVTYQVDYPVIFPQAILLLIWILYDWTGFFVKYTAQSEDKKVFDSLKLAWIQLIVVLVLVTGVFATRFGTISNYFGAGVVGEKILHLDYESQIDKMWTLDNDNLLLWGNSRSNYNIFGGSRNTYLMLSNIKDNKIMWAIPDKYIGNVYFDSNQQKVYAVTSKDYAEIKPKNPTNLLVIEAKTGQITETISLNNKDFNYIFGINSNKLGDILLTTSKNFYDARSIFNLTTNSFIKDQFSPILYLSDRSAISDDGKYVLNIGYKVQPVQFSVIDLETGQKGLEYQKELTSYNGYNNDYTIASNYVTTFDNKKKIHLMFL